LNLKVNRNTSGDFKNLTEIAELLRLPESLYFTEIDRGTEFIPSKTITTKMAVEIESAE
jgi:hypothetical protein